MKYTLWFYAPDRNGEMKNDMMFLLVLDTSVTKYDQKKVLHGNIKYYAQHGN